MVLRATERVESLLKMFRLDQVDWFPKFAFLQGTEDAIMPLLRAPFQMGDGLPWARSLCHSDLIQLLELEKQAITCLDSAEKPILHREAGSGQRLNAPARPLTLPNLT